MLTSLIFRLEMRPEPRLFNSDCKLFLIVTSRIDRTIRVASAVLKTRYFAKLNCKTPTVYRSRHDQFALVILANSRSRLYGKHFINT